MTSASEKLEQFQCPNLETCPFLKEHQSSMPELAKKLKSKYCRNDSTECARLLIRRELGPQSVPVLMMPHQHDWAAQILIDAGRADAVPRKKIC